MEGYELVLSHADELSDEISDLGSAIWRYDHG